MKTLTKDNIIFVDSLNNKDEVIRYIADLSFERGVSKNSNQTYEDIWKREETMNTALGFNISIPHTKSDSITNPTIYILKLDRLIEWGEEKIKVAICFLTPEENVNNIHLKMLANVSRKLVDEEARDILLNSTSKDEIFNIFEDIIKEEEYE